MKHCSLRLLHQLPIIYLVQDNGWGISVTKDEMELTNASDFVKGFGGNQPHQHRWQRLCLHSYEAMKNVVEEVRKERHPFLVHAKVPLLGHHTSGVQKKRILPTEEDLKHAQHDPPKAAKKLDLA